MQEQIKTQKNVGNFLLVGLFLSVFFHIAVLFLSRSEVKPKPRVFDVRKISEVRVTQTVKRVASAASPLARSSTQAVAKSQVSKTPARGVSLSESPVIVPSVPKAGNGYGKLLPGLPDFGAKGNAEGLPGGRSPYRGDKLTELLAETQFLNADFDLPLIFRRDTKNGRAAAWIQKHEGGKLELLSLNGFPEIRAALLMTLQTPSARPKIENLFKFFNSKKVKITVYLETKRYEARESEFLTEYKVYEEEIVLKITRFENHVVYGVQGGMVLDDDASRLAKANDRVELQKLKASPAYRNPMSNVML